MRGKRSSISKKKLDVVLEAIRVDAVSQQIQMIRGFRRRGVVWGDWELFKPAEVVAFLREGLRVATGRPAALEGDFEIVARVQLDSDGALQVEGNMNGDLGLPLF